VNLGAYLNHIVRMKFGGDGVIERGQDLTGFMEAGCLAKAHGQV
jgi:hypothetical protein